MKWWALSGGVALLAVVWLVTSRQADEPGSSAIGNSATAPLPSVATPTPAPVADGRSQPPRPTRAVLHGVVQQGKNGENSQALLSIDGKPVERYRIGDAVVDGWSVAAIQREDVIIANGAARA